jgi:predicted Zn-dependent protease
MTKLIDLSHHKQATDLLVGCATAAVWYGLPEASRQLVEWMKHRSDDASPVLWIDAFRNVRFENYDKAKVILRKLLQQNPKDAYAHALLENVLALCGERVAGSRPLDSVDEDALEPGVKEMLDNAQSMRSRTETSAHCRMPAYGSFIG